MYKLLISTFIYSASFLMNYNTIKDKESIGYSTLTSNIDPCYIEYLYSVPLLEYQDYLSKEKEKEELSIKKAKEAEETKKNEEVKNKDKTRAIKQKSSFGSKRSLQQKDDNSTRSNIVYEDQPKGENPAEKDSNKAKQYSVESSRKSFFIKELVSTKRVKTALLDALSELKFIAYGKVQITSGFRHWGGKKHRIGEALDISYDEDFIHWLLSNTGEKWLNKHDLSFFIEDRKKSTKDTLPQTFLAHWRYIRHATNLHIHLCLK